MAGNITFDDFLDGDGIKRGLKEIDSLIKSLEKTVEDFQKNTMQGIEQSTRVMSDRRAEVEKLKKSLEGLNTTTAQSRKKTAGLADDIEEQAKRYTEAKKASDDYKASQAAAANALVDYKEKTNDLKEKFKQLQASQDPEKTKALQLELAKLTKELNKIKKAAKEGIPPIDGFGDSQKKAAASVDGIKDRIKELTKEFNSLDQAQNPKKTAQLTFQLQQLNAEQKRLQDSIKGTNKSLGGINEAINFSANSYGDLRKKIKLLKEQLQDAEIGSREFVRTEAALNNALEREIELRERQPSLLAKRIRQAAGESKEVKKLAGTLRELRKELASTEDPKIFKKLQSQIKETEAQLDKLASSQKAPVQKGGGGGFMSSFAGGFAGAGIAGLATQGVDMLKDAIVGTVTEVLNLDKKFTELRDNIGRFSDLSGNELGQVAGDVSALSTKFGKENKEIITATRQLSKQYKLSFKDAFKLIEKGFLQGADTQGEFLDKIREYPVQLKKAGFSAEEFIKISSQEIKGGIFSDKLLDTLKEGGLKLSEATKDVTDTLTKNLGKPFTDNLLKGIKTGEISIKEAIGKIGKEADKIGINFKQQQEITAAVFGAAGEDAGGFEAIINNVNEALNSNVNELDAVGKKQAENLKLQKEYEASLERLSRNFAGLSEAGSNAYLKIKTAGLNVLSSALKINAGFTRLIAFITGEAKKLDDEKEQNLLTKKYLGENPNDTLKGLAAAAQRMQKIESILKRLKEGGRAALFESETKEFGSNADDIKKDLEQITKTYEDLKTKEADARKAQGELNDLNLRQRKGFEELAQQIAKTYGKDYAKLIDDAEGNSRSLFITQTKALTQLESGFIKAAGGVKEFSDEIKDTNGITDTIKNELSDIEFSIKIGEEIKQAAENEFAQLLDEIALKVQGEQIDLYPKVKIAPILVLDDDEPIEDINQDIRDAIESEFKPIEIESMLKAPDIASIEDATKRQIAAQQEQLNLDKERLRIMDKHEGSMIERAALQAKIINDQRELNTLKAQGASETFAAQLGEQAVSTILENQRKTMEAKQSARRAAIDSIEDEAVKSRLLAREEKRAAREKLAAQLKEVVIQATIASLKEGNKIGKALADGGKAGALSLVASLPAFKTGVIDYNGAGTTTSDSNIVRISNSESVITARGTAKAPKLLEMINAGKVSDGDYLQTNIEKHSTVTRTKDVKFEVDYKRLAKEISDATYTQDLTRLAGEVIITNENALNREKIVIETRKITGKKWQ